MRLSLSPTSSISWSDTFRAAAGGVNVNKDGSVTIEITVPGLQKEDGKVNNKGNVVLLIPMVERVGFLSELRQQYIGRPETVAEMVRRTASVDLDSESYESSMASFKFDSKILNVSLEDLEELIDELHTLLDGGREKTAAECVRRTSEMKDDVFSFRVSEESGSRAVRVKLGDADSFFEILEDKIQKAADTYAQFLNASKEE